MMQVNELNYTADMEVTEHAASWLISGWLVNHGPNHVHDSVGFKAIVTVNDTGVYGYDRISVDGQTFQGFDSGARSIDTIARGIACNAYQYCANGNTFGFIQPTITLVV